jgi:hypothetical protein
MRKELKEKKGERIPFTAVVERFGTKLNYHGYSEATMLLKDVRFSDTCAIATDHLWFTVWKTIEGLKLKINDRIQFEARVEQYSKGYVNSRDVIDNRKVDYKLTRPTKFVRLP